MPFIFFASDAGPPTPRDIIEAVIRKWAATSALTAVSSRLYFDHRPAPGTYPYAALTEVGSKDVFNTGKGYWEDKLFRIAVYSEDQDWLLNIASPAVEATFDRPRFVFANGYQMAFKRRGSDFRKEPKIGVNTQIVWCKGYTYQAQVGRTLP